MTDRQAELRDKAFFDPLSKKLVVFLDDALGALGAAKPIEEEWEQAFTRHITEHAHEFIDCPYELTRDEELKAIDRAHHAAGLRKAAEA